MEGDYFEYLDAVIDQRDKNETERINAFKDSKLIEQAKKIPGIDLKYVVEHLKDYHQDEWFRPKNADGFVVMGQLFEHYLVAKQTLPIWLSASLKGTIIMFKYNHALTYG